MNYLIIDDCKITALGLKAVIQDLYPLAAVHIAGLIPSSKEIYQTDIVLLNTSSQPKLLSTCKDIMGSRPHDLKLILYFLELSDLNKSTFTTAGFTGLFSAADTEEEISSVIQKSSRGIWSVSPSVLKNYFNQNHWSLH